jgi:hypothetical protein
MPDYVSSRCPIRSTLFAETSKAMLGHLASTDGRQATGPLSIEQVLAEEAIALNGAATAERTDDLRPQVTGQDAQSRRTKKRRGCTQRHGRKSRRGRGPKGILSIAQQAKSRGSLAFRQRHSQHNVLPRCHVLSLSSTLTVIRILRSKGNAVLNAYIDLVIRVCFDQLRSIKPSVEATPMGSAGKFHTARSA